MSDHPYDPSRPSVPDGADKQQAENQRDLIVELVIASGAELWQDPAGDTYITVEEGGHPKSFRIASDAARKHARRRWVAHARETRGRVTAPTSQALKDALGALDALASEGPVYLAFVRIGHANGRIYIDLGDPSGRAVEITKDGWSLVDRPPVRFVRPSGLLALPQPVKNPEGVNALQAILPDATDATDAKILLLIFLVGTFLSTGAMPLLAISGRQGSGKTTLVNRLRSLVDPNQAPARQQPRNEDDLIIAAKNGAMVCFDNLSFLDRETSDALCRLATGAGMAKRKLYTDLDEVIVQVRRAAIINGIPDLIRMPDLADRALVVELAPRSSYAPLAELDAAFERERPKMLGALYDAVSAGLRGHAQEPPSPGIRMVDLERWARAALRVFGFDPDAVSAAMIENRLKGDRMLIEDDATASLLVQFLEDKRSFRGTASDLLLALCSMAPPHDWRGCRRALAPSRPT